MWGNKVLLKWQEPRYALKDIKKQVSWMFWLRLHTIRGGKWALVFLVLGIVGDYFSPNFISTYLELFYLTAFGFGCGFILSFLGWLATLSPVEIRIREKDLSGIGVDSFIVKHKEIKSCTIRDIEFEDVKFEILEINFWNGQQGAIEIAPEISGETVLRKLEECGVQVDFRKQPFIRQNTLNQIA